MKSDEILNLIESHFTQCELSYKLTKLENENPVYKESVEKFHNIVDFLIKNEDTKKIGIELESVRISITDYENELYFIEGFKIAINLIFGILND